MGCEESGRVYWVSFSFSVPVCPIFQCCMLGWVLIDVMLGVCRLGMASFVLETIPFVSIVFSFTNAVGAALWASDIEKAIQ